ncbi:MAG: helix-turn-helix domain-containing protein [Actinomycetota bacterium]
MSKRSHPFAAGIKPLIDAMGATEIPVNDAVDGDIVLEWEGEPVVAVRLVDIVSLARLVAGVEEQLGSPLAKLDRADKQRAVRLLDERGAFQLRKSIEDVAEAMGVSRITIYNYLSALKNQPGEEVSKGAR